MELSQLKDMTEGAIAAYEALRKIYSKTQEIRWSLFLKGCARAIESDGSLGSRREVRLAELFDNNFAKKSAYDFIRKVMEANSQIAQLALARLYVRCATREHPHATYDELALLRAYAELDDREANTFLLVCEIVASVSGDGPIDLVRGKLTGEKLQMSVQQFEAQKVRFQELGCQTPAELENIMESFARRQLFTSVIGGFSTVESSAFCVLKNSRSDAFVSDLMWSFRNAGVSAS